jgi:hypothetical protein
MKREMSHDEAFVALDAAALDALDADERDAVFAHVAGCAECRLELETLRATAAHLAFAAPLAADSPTHSRERIRSRLVARATANAEPALAPASTPSATLQDRVARARIINMLAWRRAEWMAVAASILMVVSIGLLASVVRGREQLQELLNVQVAQTQQARVYGDSLRSAVASRDSMIDGLTGPGVAMMSLTASGANAPFARMFWDHDRNTWTLVAHNMPALKTGRTYQLWLMTPSAKISAGTFDSRNGDALMRATYALSPDSLRALAVTEEPAGGVPQPTGGVIVAMPAQR